jgi:tetratricopeptide (TPR) repeat protein
VQSLVLILLAASLITLQVLLGGARVVYLLPACLLVAAAGLGVIGLRGTVRVRPDRLCLASTVALAAFVVGRAALSPVPYLARPDLLMSLAGLVVYLVSTLFLSGTQQRFTMTLILVLVGIAHVSIGVVQFTGQSNFMLLPWIARPDFGFRASGFLISPNHLAALLGMLGVLTLSICCWSRVELPARAFAFYGFIACLTGIALTGSRVGYFSTAAGLGLFAGISAYLARRFNRPNFFGVAMATAFVLTAIVAATLVFVVQSEIYEKRLRHVRDSSRQAELLAPAALQQHRLNPAWGTGSGTFLYHGRQFHGPEVQADPRHVHNDYLELLAEYGWCGVALFGIFLLAHLRAAGAGVLRVLDQKLKPTAWTASNELALLAGALCALTIGFVHALRDFTFHLPGNALLAAFLFAILANPTVESASRREGRPLPPWLAWLAPVVALLLLIAAAPRLWSEVLTERARLALRDHDYPAAVARARRASGSDPANPDAAYYAGEASRYLAREAGDASQAGPLRREAVAAFESGLKAFPRDVRLLLKLGQVLDDLGESERATHYFEQALAAAPNSGTVHACCGVHWHRQWNLDRAQRFYRRAQELGETQLSSVGLSDLERDRSIVRENDAFADLRPDRPAEAAPPVR